VLKQSLRGEEKALLCREMRIKPDQESAICRGLTF
jgi:hypothetical protein